MTQQLSNLNHKKSINQFGLTMVEFLVYFALFSILIVVINSLFITAIEQRSYDQSRSAIQQESEYVLSKLIDELYNTDQVLLPSELNSSTSTLQYIKNGEDHTISVVDQVLKLSRNGQVWNLTSPSILVSDLLFQWQSNSSNNSLIKFSAKFTYNSNDFSSRNEERVVEAMFSPR